MKITHTAVFEGELQLSLTDDWLPWSSGKLVEIKTEGERVRVCLIQPAVCH